MKEVKEFTLAFTKNERIRSHSNLYNYIIYYFYGNTL